MDNGYRRSGGRRKKIRADADLFTQYALADRLHKTLDELRLMTVDEYVGWVAYVKVSAEMNKNGTN